MMAMTTNNSTSVKAQLFLFSTLIIISYVKRVNMTNLRKNRSQLDRVLQAIQ